MSLPTFADAGKIPPIVSFVRRTIGWMESVPYWLVALMARVPVAAVFWRSGRTKVDGWNIFQVNDSAIHLFENEFGVPLLSPLLAAHLRAIAEHVFPVLLVVGLATRYSALALLGMTAVIEIFVFPDAWPTHGTWAACFLILIVRGPGVVSLDHLIARQFK
jgi:putative oxidoreductase